MATSGDWLDRSSEVAYDSYVHAAGRVGILTGILIILWIYKSTLTMHEDDSIFLNETESQMHKDQVEVLAKMKKITPILKVLGALSGLMILVIAGLFIYQGLNASTTLQ